MKSNLFKNCLTYTFVLLLVILVMFPINIGNYIEIPEQKIIAQGYSFDRDLYREHIYQIYNHITTKVVKKSNYYFIESIQLNNSLQLSQSLVGTLDSPWPVYCHDNRHSGRSPYSTVDIDGFEKWRFLDDHWIEINPVIDNNGVIYLCNDWGVVTALYPNGTVKWKFTTGGQIIGSSPIIHDDGTIFVGSWDGKLYAINSNGTLKWDFYSGDIITSSPVIADDGTIYFGTEGAKVYAVYSNGTEKWHYTTGDWITSNPAIGNDGTVYIGSMDYYLYALYPNGTLRWRFNIGDRIYGSPSIDDDGTIYIGSSWNSYLYALFSNGTLKWKYAGAGTPNNPSIGSDGTIYTGYLHDLKALYPNGTLKWDFYVGDNRWIGSSAPAISADGTIYFGICIGNDEGGEIVAVNSNGIEHWRKRIANFHVHSSPSIAEDGTVYIGSSFDMGGGFLYAFGIGPLEADADGPYYGLFNQPVQLKGSSVGGYSPKTYHWTFGDGQTSDEQNPIHTYANPGNYTVTLTVTDNSSNTTSNATFAWIQETNTPPNKPTIEGPTKGNKKTSYPYTISTSDAEESIIWYYIDWGDNTNTDWIGPFNSGTEITKSHSWNNKGTYIIKVKAKDPYNAESSETTLEVTMPRTRISFDYLFMRFLERFPILQKVLNFQYS